MRRGFIAALVAAALLVAGCGGDPVPKPVVSGTIPSAAPGTAEPPEPSGSPTALETAEPVTPSQGGRYWAVYVAFGAFDAPEIEEGLQRLADRGIEAGVSSLGCDQGADRIFGTDEPDAALVGVYFDTEPDGIAFLATLDEPAYGPVRVRTYCLD